MNRLSLTTLSFLLLVLASGCRGSVVERATLQSRLLDRTIEYLVVLPHDYTARREAGHRFPVVYFLHCAGCDAERWLDESYGADIDRLIDEVSFIAVALNDGSNDHATGFTWWIDSPKLPRQQMSTFLVSEFKPHIDSLYATRPEREFTGVTGHSMGGFGAFHTIIEHPDIFGAAYSMKGGFDVSRPLNPNWPSDFGFETLLGTATEDSGNWHDVNILENICRLRGDAVSLGFYSGAQDEWFHEENVRLHMILDSCGIQHVFEIADETHFSIPFSRMRSVGAFFDSAFSKARESGRLPGPGFGAPGRGKSRTGENRFVLTPAGRRVRSIAPQYPQRRRVASGVYLEFPRGFRALPTIRMTSRRPGEPTYGPAAGNR